MITQAWSDIIPDSQLGHILQMAMEHAAYGLSDMVGQKITIKVPQVDALPIGHVPNFANDPEAEMAGVYLLIEGGFTGQVILMLPLAEARYLVDLLMDVPRGTTLELGEMERSALAEAGNLTTSYFLNEIAARTQILARPSPPAVIIDMLGAIVNVVTTPVAAVSNTLVIAQTAFQVSGQTIMAYFWVLPNPTAANGYSVEMV